jgi:flagellar basal-body rod protein FlgB
MPIDNDAVFGVHAPALALRARRAELLAANLANSDTPGYHARDIDFQATLSGSAGGGLTLAGTDRRHLGRAGFGTAAEPAYRVALQPSLDGNSVDPNVEYAAFLDNAMRYQASLQFLDSRIDGIRRALTGD